MFKRNIFWKKKKKSHNGNKQVAYTNGTDIQNRSKVYKASSSNCLLFNKNEMDNGRNIRSSTYSYILSYLGHSYEILKNI